MEPILYLSVLIGAGLLDFLVGDPPGRLHPVAWIGGLIGKVCGLAPGGSRARLLFGLSLVLTGGLLIGGFMLLFQQLVPVDQPIGWLLHVLLLKLSFSLSGLRSAGQRIHRSLVEGDLERARRQLGWDLVSRPTDALSPDQVAGATIESLVENLTDSFVAPLLAYALGGLAGAWVYRFVNTADAMIGYRTEQFEHVGKSAARLDDWLNWLPARLSAAFILIASFISRASVTGAWQALLADRGATASPNAGWTMAAAGGALGLRLEKVGHYTLNSAGRAPSPSDLAQAEKLLLAAAALAFGCAAVLGMVIRGL